MAGVNRVWFSLIVQLDIGIGSTPCLFNETGLDNAPAPIQAANTVATMWLAKAPYNDVLLT